MESDDLAPHWADGQSLVLLVVVLALIWLVRLKVTLVTRVTLW